MPVRIEATDRKGLESQGQGLALFGAPRMQRLLRYCARPIFTRERLLWAPPAECRGQGRALYAAPRMQCLIYQLPKPRPDGQTALSLTPMEFLEQLAMLMPPPGRHRRRSHGVLAPRHCPAPVTARAGLTHGGTLVFGRTGALSKRLPKREAPDLNSYLHQINLGYADGAWMGGDRSGQALEERQAHQHHPARLLTIIDQAAAREGGSRWRSPGTEAP